jgi:hypothetical protein
LVASIVVGSSQWSTAQGTGAKVVRFQGVEQITDAVLISNVSVGGNTVECGLFIKPPAVIQAVTPFQAGNDWFKQMTISLVNRTSKIIVFGGLIFHFLDVGNCSTAQPCVEGEIHLGERPAVDAFTGRGQPIKPEHPERPPLLWKPHETIVIHVGDYLSDLEQNLAPFVPITSITKITISLGAFNFKDGMQWDSRRYAVPDPQQPGKFNELPADYFPGRRETNWPPGYDR